ncbi:serine hydrolase domain-containing protein [Magnetospirillum fulvum]|uniref:CubicO group peptidase, beta-lactamase class C family n=1 Tax=Magnetospirillum fulvum TaxID=1082 RepID=A0A1H6H9N3_MAGFU|nr:serine hydrolase domain-containing protein [Magnetospirillum fulvum]SEH32186.1 CubicO group peptidase, beta-lactamase class C family [Magnetospirillum fulvum]
MRGLEGVGETLRGETRGKRLCRCLAAVAGLALLSACGTLTTWEIDPASLPAGPSDLTEQVDKIAAPLVTQGETPGLIVGILLPDGTTRFFGYGTTGQPDGVPPGPDTLFAIGSLSKGFMGAIVATMVQDGSLSWADPLATLLPPGTKLSPDAARITVEQLATHTSGLPRQPLDTTVLTGFVSYLFTGENFYQHLDRDAVLAYLADFTAPGEVVPRYSNIGYGLLSHVASVRSGRSVDDLLAERITGPLGLTRTGYVAERLPGYDVRAIGHAGDQPKFILRGDTVPDWRFTDILRGSAALYSSARDLLSFAAAHLRDDDTPLGRSLADAVRVRTPRPRQAAAVAWIADDVLGLHITYQVGIVAGYTSYLGIDTAHHTAVVILQNAFNWDYSAGHALLKILATNAAYPS